jgi:hypothetical protein
VKPTDLVALRRRAEQAVADMAEGPLKVKAFEVILGFLLTSAEPAPTAEPAIGSPEGTRKKAVSSLAARVAVLAEEGFFAQPRSLAEIQLKLAEHGWHYPQTNLSTPLIRLVRQRDLRRLQLAEGNKRVWKYSLP